MIPKISIQAETHIPVIRKVLQRQSALTNLDGGSIRNIITTMIIPGGMSRKEAFVYKLTGKFPKSVLDRWYVAGNGNRIIHEGDQEVKIGDHLLGDPDFVPHDVNLDDYPDFLKEPDSTGVGDIMDDII